MSFCVKSKINWFLFNKDAKKISALSRTLKNYVNIRHIFRFTQEIFLLCSFPSQKKKLCCFNSKFMFAFKLWEPFMEWRWNMLSSIFANTWKMRKAEEDQVCKVCQVYCQVWIKIKSNAIRVERIIWVLAGFCENVVSRLLYTA